MRRRNNPVGGAKHQAPGNGQRAEPVTNAESLRVAGKQRVSELAQAFDVTVALARAQADADEIARQAVWIGDGHRQPGCEGISVFGAQEPVNEGTVDLGAEAAGGQQEQGSRRKVCARSERGGDRTAKRMAGKVGRCDAFFRQHASDRLRDGVDGR